MTRQYEPSMSKPTVSDKNALRQKLHSLIEEAINSDVELNVLQPRTLGDTTTLVLTWRPTLPAIKEVVAETIKDNMRSQPVREDPMDKLRRLATPVVAGLDPAIPDEPEPYDDPLDHAIPDDLPDPELYEGELPGLPMSHIKIPEVIPEPEPPAPIRRGPGRPPKEKKA